MFENVLSNDREVLFLSYSYRFETLQDIKVKFKKYKPKVSNSLYMAAMPIYNNGNLAENVSFRKLAKEGKRIDNNGNVTDILYTKENKPTFSSYSLEIPKKINMAKFRTLGKVKQSTLNNVPLLLNSILSYKGLIYGKKLHSLYKENKNEPIIISLNTIIFWNEHGKKLSFLVNKLKIRNVFYCERSQKCSFLIDGKDIKKISKKLSFVRSNINL